MPSLASRIQEIRKHTKLNKVQFGKLAGVSHAAVGQWEGGETKSLKFEALMRIQKETGYDANWIDTGKGSKFVTDRADPQRDRVQQKIAALSTERKQQLNKMSPEDITNKIRALNADQQTAIQAMFDSWETQAPQND